MAELSGFGRKFTAKDYRFGILLTLHLSVFTALCVFIIWNYCHLAGEGPCQLEEIDDDGDYVYVRSNLTSAQKKKCKKYQSGTCVTVYVN